MTVYSVMPKQKHDAEDYTAFFDGACEPVNPGGTAAFGALVLRGREYIWDCSALYQPPLGHEGQTSNNVAEYAGLNALLDFFIEQNLMHARITVHGDSQLVINQCFGNWKIRKGFYAPLAFEAREKLKVFRAIRGVWIPRGQNAQADALSKALLRKRELELAGHLD